MANADKAFPVTPISVETNHTTTRTKQPVTLHNATPTDLGERTPASSAAHLLPTNLVNLTTLISTIGQIAKDSSATHITTTQVNPAPSIHSQVPPSSSTPKMPVTSFP